MLYLYLYSLLHHQYECLVSSFAGDSISKVRIICEIDIKSEDDQKRHYLRSVAGKNHQVHHIIKDVRDSNILMTVEVIETLQVFDNI